MSILNISTRRRDTKSVNERNKRWPKKFSTKLDSALYKNFKKSQVFEDRDLPFAKVVLSQLKNIKDIEICNNLIKNATNRQSFTEKELNFLTYLVCK